MEPEGDDNIIITCGKHADQLYPSKGKYTRGMLKYAKVIKACFGTGPKEHMWVLIERLDEEFVVGTLANIPVILDSPKYGDRVSIPYKLIEDAQ